MAGGGTPLLIQHGRGWHYPIKTKRVLGINSNRPLGIITKMAWGVTMSNYKRRTTPHYKGATSVYFIDGTTSIYNAGTPIVCSLFFLYLFSYYMYHTHLKNIQIFAILTFTKFFRFRV